MEKTVAVDSQSEILKGVSEISLSSSSVVALPHEVILQSPVENKNVDVSNMSNAELMKFLQDKELSKMREKYLKQNQKGKDTDIEHKFWNTQPMPGLKDVFDGESGPMDGNTDVTAVRQEPYNMPGGFEWDSLDVTDPDVILEVYTLLCENYVEDDDCLFRFDYSVPFLQWALTPPGFLQDWHVGVRNSKTGALMGCITAIPADIRIHDKKVSMVEINFLCVHKKLRTKRLAPVLIKEITRRVNMRGRWQAAYTAGIVLPKPVGRCRYYHRSLNPKKLVEVKFSSIRQGSTMAKLIKELKLPTKPTHAFRKMEEIDMPMVHKLLTESLSRRKLAQMFTVEDLAHTLLPRVGVIESWVLENKGVVTDFCSYYHLPSTVFKCPKHNNLGAVYSYYNVATTIDFKDLMHDALILARNSGADVFNALDLSQNGDIFTQLAFGAGDGYLQYYIYNW
eukprot:CAMPEP_0119045000 /NCGR_PEP_ID=MMETSP1177-20130426/36191_1 /TAXON_ID=2985 /ORGANISM="Ochromonas sp, Strain CCMP1899" /LENGTH=450 /DNA_ID=CAMNT_0007016021 /DNA_START=57 /DNA_END=1406 /DNA_ORIENTATION=+